MKTILSALLLLASVPVNAQPHILDKLDRSPRHHEWIDIPAADRSVKAFVAYPESADKALTVIVIHENRGLTDWVRGFADDMAAAGHIAIAPDFLSGFSDGFSRTADFPNQDAARDALYQVPPERITAFLDAVKAHIAAIPAANGTVVVAGFCWGGTQAFRYATTATGLRASMVFYGSAPSDTTAFAGITAPVIGFYAENDQRINAALPEVSRAMAAYRKAFEPVIYPASGHAFMRSGEEPSGSEGNKAARAAAIRRLLAILETL